MSRLLQDFENVSDIGLLKNIPVIIRLSRQDAKGFSIGSDQDLDKCIISTMDKVAAKLSEKIHGVSFAYVAYTDIALLLTDFDAIQSDVGTQFLCSWAASIATGCFVTELLNDNNLTRLKGATYKDIQDRVSTTIFSAEALNIAECDVSDYFTALQDEGIGRVINAVYMLKQKGKEKDMVDPDLVTMFPFMSKLFGEDTEKKKELCAEELARLPDGYMHGRFLARAYSGNWLNPMPIPLLSGDKSFIAWHAKQNLKRIHAQS